MSRSLGSLAIGRPTAIPDTPWESATPELQALIHALVEQNTALGRRVADLQATLNLRSTIAPRPPSSDSRRVKRVPACKPTGQERGGQRGHRRRQRAPVPPEPVPAAVDGITESWRG
jgi:hypothetical protein